MHGLDFSLLQDVVIIFALAIVVLFICHRFRIPAIVGYLITGMLAGPNGFKLISAVSQVEVLAEIGVVFLLFTIGIEFSLRNLVRVSRSVFLGGAIQVFLTIAVIYVIAYLRQPVFSEALFIGFLIALSSTAIVLKILQEKAQIESPHGQNALAILIFQDLIIVPMILVVPILAGTIGNPGQTLLIMLVKAAAIVALMVVAARHLVPRLLYQIAKTQSRELFLLTIIVIAFSVAWLTFSIGLSLALGAFLAGLIISESEYSEHALGNVVPFLDIFTSFFFVSIGMLFDVRFIIENAGLVIGFTLLVLVVKTTLASGAVFLMGFPLRTALLSGIALSQVGEFSFILSREGLHAGVLSEQNYPLFMSVSILTMALTPFLIEASPRIASLILKLPWPEKAKSGLNPMPAEIDNQLRNHLVIIGYGVNGRNVAAAAKSAGIPYRIIEMNPNTVRIEKQKGEPIFFGDASQEVVLDYANLKSALVLVVAVADAVAIRRILHIARLINPHVHIIIRSRFLRDVKAFYELGADEVIPEEFETSIEIFTRVLTRYLIPLEEIEQQVRKVREGSYAMFRSLSIDQGNTQAMFVKAPSVEVNNLRVYPGSPVSGLSIAGLDMASVQGVSLLAVSRQDKVIPQPPLDFVLQAGDHVYFLGHSLNLDPLRSKFSKSKLT